MNNHEQRDAGVSRREFVGAGAVTAAILAGGFGAGGIGASASAQPDRRRVRTDRPRNVILMISDGMSPGVLQLGEHFAQRVRDRSSAWMDLCHADRAQTTLMSTDSASGPVTDSGAAGTSFSVGLRAENGALCVLPNGSRPTPLVQRLKAAGRATGLVTTTQLAHATPAAFVVNHPKRHEYAPIAVQMLAQRPDVMLGGGADYFTEERLNTHAPSATVLRTRDELRKGLPDEGPVMGFFTDDHMSYEVDRPDDEPTLAEMTGAALGRLSRDAGGFFLMVEAGRVDHAAHANDIVALLHDQLAFDDAVRTARDFADARGDTLLIVTSDHANANPGITMYAEKGARGFERLCAGKGSFGALYDEAGGRRNATPESLATAAKSLRGVEFTDFEMDAVAKTMNRRRVSVFDGLDSTAGVLGSVFANHYATGFMSTNHTSDHVVLTATGPASGALPALGHINDLHAMMTHAMGLS